MSEILYFDTPADLRDWFAKHHDQQSELWIGFHKKGSSQKGVTYAESVDEALCFGWIDGVRKSVDETRYANRFTPRTARSIWSDINLKRIEELREQGRLHPAGLAAYEKRDRSRTKQYSFEQASVEFPEAYEKTFREHETAWSFFQKQGASYRKTITWWVISAKQEATRLKRLATLIEASQHQRKLT